MNDELMEILRACPSTEPATFSEFLRGLPSPPMKGEREEWASLFRQIEYAESLDLIEVERTNGKIESLMLTQDGIGRLKK